MQKSNPPLAKWNIIFIIIACLVVTLDQLSKQWIRSHLALGQSIPEDGFFRLTHVENTGAAFSIFSGRADTLALVSIFGAVLILLYAFVFSRNLTSLNTRFSKIALGLMLGGTIGNLIDRISMGRVTDFFDVGTFPVFNIADSCLDIGVVIFAISLLIASRTPDKVSKPD
jgi:signal peptidase II